jgi:hypothetical protein
MMGRMLMLLLKSPPPMMFDLILEVMNGFSAKIGSIVPLDGAVFLIFPGASCLAWSLDISVFYCGGGAGSVPEGRCDRSLARSAWNSVTPKEPSRRVRSDSCGCAHRFDDWSDERIIGLDSSNLSKSPKLCLATGLWRIQRWDLAGAGNGP